MTAEDEQRRKATTRFQAPTWEHFWTKVCFTFAIITHVNVSADDVDVSVDDSAPIIISESEPHHETEAGHHHGPAPFLPEDYPKPKPLTWLQGFLDPEPIIFRPDLQWFGHGRHFSPALTVYGSYHAFGTALEDAGRTNNGIGHQLLIDVDLSLGATERIHAQWRPLGEKNTGGSFWRLSGNPDYIDNSSALPQRVWFEGDISEVFSGYIPDNVPLDIAITAGLYPYQLHNNLLINDDIVGVMVSKNTFIIEPFSNILVQVFGAFDEIDAYRNEDDIRIYGFHSAADWQTRRLEASYIHLLDSSNAARNADYFAFSILQLLGPHNLAGRILANVGDEVRNGAGQLYVAEHNWTREFDNRLFGIFDSLVVYSTAFWATPGWNSISGGNFDRLRNTFAVNPLVRLSLDPVNVENRGVTVGAELFTNHQNTVVIPEIAAEFPGHHEVVGIGCRLRQKIGRRSQAEIRGITTITGTNNLGRHGLFLEWITFF